MNERPVQNIDYFLLSSECARYQLNSLDGINLKIILNCIETLEWRHLIQ